MDLGSPGLICLECLRRRMTVYKERKERKTQVTPTAGAEAWTRHCLYIQSGL